ncbi:MAG: glycoside hydrolase family 78 protein [Tannerella sp.]|jgi:alpha-L-rhamnosidase|nr:glycoside hydrolase family 78 protein [Tannerella sp.]
MKRTYLYYLLIPLSLLMGCQSDVQMQIVEMQVEMRKNPDGIGVQNPKFSWQLQTDATNVLQTAYQIEVAASAEDLNAGSNLLWNSGKVKSDRSVLLSYEGQPLESGKAYCWKVTVWTNKRNSVLSEPGNWSMGLLNTADWKAQWIGINDLDNVKKDAQGRTRLSARYLRNDFNVSQPVKRAMLYISGVGSSVTSLNGKLVSDDVFAPLPTLYTTTVYYNTYDVTSLLKTGQNAIGVVLGNGRYLTMRERNMVGFGVPRLIAQIDIEYENGKHDFIVSNDSWQATNKGPIIANNEFDGEEYDARLALGNWTEAGFDASKAPWQKADVMDAPGGKLTAQPSDNLKVMEEIKPVSVKAIAGGKYIVDMGQNMVGWLKINLQGKKGKPVTMRFAEILKEGGEELYLDNIRGALVTDIYTPGADGVFSWEPSFVYHGFRFAEISGLDYQPQISDFTGKVVYDNMPTIGHFETSNAMVNQIYKNAYWGIRGNYRGMPTDCPQRDERLGWLGDRATGAHGESFIFRNALLYNKWMKDIEDSMNENGSISVVSPRFWTIYNDDVTWPSAFFYISEMLYRQYGDASAIKQHYPAMKKWVQHQIDTQMQDYILMKDTYGDWCMPPESQELIHSQDPARKTSGQVLSTTVFYSILQLMSEFAVLNGIPADTTEYNALAAKIKDAYNKKFFNTETAQYDNNTVTANILSLQLGLVPDGYEEKVFANIVDKTEKEFQGHVSVGVLGIQHLMRGLTKYNNIDLAYKIVTNETYPSWGYMVKKDATTIWELWNGDTADPAMNSANHVMLLGDLLIWFYEDLAGIKNCPEGVAFKHIRMKPVFPQGLTNIDASYQSPYGLIKSAWTRNGESLTWNITIPPNTTATVELPASLKVKMQKQPGLLSSKETGDMTVFELGSGSYQLQSE